MPSPSESPKTIRAVRCGHFRPVVLVLMVGQAMLPKRPRRRRDSGSYRANVISAKIAANPSTARLVATQNPSLGGGGRDALGALHLEAMLPMKAVVKNGRLVLDEPTELPDGTEIELLPVDDDFDAEERARLLQAIDEGIEDFERGDHVDGVDFIAQLRARREAASR